MILYLAIPFIFLAIQVARKKLIAKFNDSHKVIYYVVSLIIIIAGSITNGVLLVLLDMELLDSSGLGKIVAMIAFGYFFLTHPKIYVNQNGDYSLKE